MKIAVSGKGGVGKTTLSALLAMSYVRAGYKVFAIDADPDANLAYALGFPRDVPVTPLVEMKDLIRERVGAEPGKATVYFKMNPKVDDIPEKFSVERNGVKLMAMGTVRRGGSGCVCPENVMVRQLLSHLLVQRDEVVLMDMEAGVEHLGRGTTQFVDVLLAVVEPSTASLHRLERIRKLAGDLGLKRVAVVANRIGGADGAARIAREAGEEPWCTLPYSDTLVDYHGQGAGADIEAEIDSLRVRIEEELKHG